MTKFTEDKRYDVRLLAYEAKTKNRNEWLMRLCWNVLDKPVQLYLIARACDMFFFGRETADRTWPEPLEIGFLLIGHNPAAALVTDLVKLLEKANKESYDVPKHSRGGIIKYSDELVPVPVYLSPRTLSAGEIETLRSICVKELSEVDAKVVIDNFGTFAGLLSKPENHILVQSAQYVENAVPSRTVSDMTNEMAQELAGLPHYTAYVRLIEEKDGRQRIVKEKIETIPLPKISEDAIKQTVERRKAVEENSRRYLKRRDLIEEEIAKRQERWLSGGPLDKPPTPRSETRGDEAKRRDPPPTRSRPPPD
jgi:hypothetical protein